MAWKLKYFKTQANIIFHRNDWQIQTIRQLNTSKAMWDKLKTQNEHIDMVSKVAIHKMLIQLTLQKTQ